MRLELREKALRVCSSPLLGLMELFLQVYLIIEILHTFSRYLEALVLIPQFVLLYKRQKYEAWVLFFTVLLGAESLARSMPLLLAWQTQQSEDPYGEIHACPSALDRMSCQMWLTPTYDLPSSNVQVFVRRLCKL